MNWRLLIPFLSMVLFAGSVSGQYTHTCRITDAGSGQPIAGATVLFATTGEMVQTDYKGNFTYTTTINPNVSGETYSVRIQNNMLYYQTNENLHVSICNILGQKSLFEQYIPKYSSGVIELPNFHFGLHILTIATLSKKKSVKLVNNSIISIRASDSLSDTTTKKVATLDTDSIFVSKPGYYAQHYALHSDVADYPILKTSYNNLLYLNSLPRKEAFDMLQSVPFNPVFGETQSIKVIYAFKEKKIYFINSSKFDIHYTFAASVLGYAQGHYIFNMEQYTDNPNRIYYQANLNHFTASDVYTLDFFAGDELSCEEVADFVKAIENATYIGKQLKFYATSGKWNACTDVASITSDELYKGQNFQPLNVAESYGYLQKVTASDMVNTYLGRHDIVVLQGITNDIPLVAGIITTSFQTPLSHINVLSHNRGTPNMALRDAWDNDLIEAVTGKLVYLKVTLDSFVIRPANLSEAQHFWSKHEPSKTQVLKRNATTHGIIELSNEGTKSVALIGGKASNFAELKKITDTNGNSLPLPEAAFAIPFYYYCEHLKHYGLDTYIDNMLADSLFAKDYNYRKNKLAALQDSIINAPLDTNLIQLVNEKLAQDAGYTNYRFRSSTNAEDIEGFNGAGLYESFTGIRGDTKKTIAKAIRKVWASLWYLRAFDEREYFHIDQTSVAMAVLVHRAFPAEAANGVVITKNMYNTYNRAFTINVQVGELSIVLPEDSNLPDQIIFYMDVWNLFEYISHTTVPGMEGKTVLTDNELKQLAWDCELIYNHYCAVNQECKPLDIEFKIDVVGGKRKLYIKQARVY